MAQYHLRRVKEILAVFFEEGFGFLIKKAHLHHLVPFSKRWQASLLAKEKAWKPEVHLREALSRLGPTFIKFGQVLSLRPDILPPEYIEELEKMQDRAPSIPLSEVRSTIKKELGKEPEKLFASFDPKPVASASLAQVHKAKLRSGEVVAVKVQRPDVEKTIKEDIEILLFIAHWLEKHKVLGGVPFIALVEEFKRWTLREINFNYEATNLRLFRENFKKSPDVIIPRVYENYSTEHVLTMQFIEGIPLHDITQVRKKENVRALMRKSYKAMGEMIFVQGLFHADPHPGNILISKNRIAFIDFGIVGRFDDKLRRTVLGLVDATLKNDPDRALDALLDMQTEKTTMDRGQLRQDIQDIIDQLHFGEVKDIKISQLLSKEMEIIHRYNIRVPIDFILFAKTIITLEGLGLRYNPGFKLLAETEPLLRQAITKEYMPTALAKRLRRQAHEYRKMMEKGPTYIDDTFRRINEGRLDIELVPREFAELRVEIEHGAGNIAIGLMIAALIVSAALLMQIVEGPKIPGITRLSTIGFVVAGVLGAWLVRRTIFTQHGLR